MVVKKCNDNLTKDNHSPSKKESVIKSSNTNLILKEGLELAIVEENGTILKQGPEVHSDVFTAMMDQVIKSFCSRFKGFTEDDFRD